MRRIAGIILAWAGVLLPLALGAAVAFRSSEHREVLLVNPLDEPVSVRFGDEARDVAAEGGVEELWLPAGVHDVKVVGSRSGRLLDDHRVVVPPDGAGTAIYAALGAAPLYRVDVVLDHAGVIGAIPGVVGSPRGYEDFRLLTGPRFQVVAADVVFTPPPEQVRGWFGSKTYLGLNPGGWRAGLWMALDHASDAEELLAVATRLRRALPEDANLAWSEAAIAASLDGAGAALARAADALGAAPDSADVNGVWAWAMRAAGRTAELRARARELAVRAPDAVASRALLLHALPAREAAAEAANVAAGPASAHDGLLAAAAYVLLQTGHAARAAELYQELAARDATRPFAEDQLRALVLAGRTQTAAAVALAHARREDAGPGELARYLRVAALPGAAPEVAPEELLASWAESDPEREQRARSLAGLAPRPPGPAGDPEGTLGSILAWALHQPDHALELCRTARRATLAAIPPELAGLLAVEAYRTGRHELFERLRWRLPLSAAKIAAYVDRGVEPEDGWRTDAAGRAALALGRARALQASGGQVPADVARAIRADPLGGGAALAVDRWPAPAPAAAPVVLVLRPER